MGRKTHAPDRHFWGTRGSTRLRAWQHLLVNVILSLLEGTPLSEGVIARPFTPDPGFDDRWWLGIAKGDVVFCSLTTDACGEVARAQIRLHSTLGAAYPTYTRPRHGSTEIDLLEVRTDLRGRGLGREAVDRLLVGFLPPYVALSLDNRSDDFWRSLGWTEHIHPHDRGRSLFVQPE